MIRTTPRDGDPCDLMRYSVRSRTGLLLRHLAATMGTALAVWVLFAACADSKDEGSTIPAVTQVSVTPEVAGSEQVNDQGVFLRVIAPLDEARGYCLDIPGHRSGVRIESPLHVHTCKHGIWNQDGRFDAGALGNGVIRMPHYGLCLKAESATTGARLLLVECTGAELQTWAVQDQGEIALDAFRQMCITVEDSPGRGAGGPQYLIRAVGLDSCAQQASDRQRWTTLVPR